MKNIILIAPPAAGKGTQSKILAQKYNYTHISIGDLLRTEIDNDSELGREAKIDIDQGILVKDEIVIELLRNILEHTTGPFVLDGYPRTLKQAKMLDQLLSDINNRIDAALFFNITEEEAVKRAIGRLSCPECNKLYNLYEPSLKPKFDDLCDECNSPLTTRSDDTESTFKTRYHLFMQNTLPLLEYYESIGILVNIAVKETVMETFNEVEKEIL